MYGVKVQPLVNSVGTITNTYGVYIDSLTAGTQTNAAYGIYQAGTDKNYFGGNVGIGTTNPGYKLQVNADGAGLYVLGANTAPYTQTIASFVYGGNGNSINIENQGGKASIQARAGSSSMDLILNAAGSNVGIGTSSPAQKLDVAGGDIILSSNATYIRSKDASGNTPRMFGINSSNDTYIGPIDSYAGGAVLYGVSANVSSQTFYTGASARVHINSSGNVGIGTTTPTTTLDIQSTTTGSIRISGSAGSQITLVRPTAGLFGYVRYITGTMEIGTNSSDGLNLNTANTTRLTIQTNGNVGIGTSIPSVKLDVIGSIRSEIAVDGNFLTLQATGQRVHYIKRSGQILQFTSDGASTYDVQFDSSNGSVYFATGNVGIGTASPESL
jgi:hypothetical protein